MLSQTLIQDLPHSLESNLDYRRKLLSDCEKDKKLQEDTYFLCKNDIIFWINAFCWTKDQRTKPASLRPFICYEAYQEDYILKTQEAINNGHDLLTEKTRDMGVSWMILYVFTHEWLFNPGADFRVGSRKEDYVDKLGDIDTLLEKVRFTLARQPLFLLPKGFDPEKHASYMRIVNPVNGNAIVGESANEHFGSGGRRKALLLDEFAKWETKVAEAAWTSTADVTPCRIVVSTPVGSGNKFAMLANGTAEKIEKISLHWTLHPDKSKGAYYLDAGIKIPIADSKRAFEIWKSGIRVRSPWYDSEAERRSEADLAQEIDIDYLKSGYPFFSLIELNKQRVWTYIERKNPSGPIPYGNYIKASLVELDGKIEVRERPDGWLRIYELPKSEYQYVVSGDISEGLEKGDESFMVVRDKITRNVVACCNGLFAPTDDFDLKLWKVAKYYNKAKLAPENNNHGYAVVQNLKLMDCDLYQTRRINELGHVTINKAGWTTDNKSRPDMLDQMEEEIRRSAIELRDDVLITQCKTFVKNPKTGKPEADGRFLDDGVLACAIAGAVIKEEPYKAKVSANKAKNQAAVDDAKKAYRNPFRV